MKQNEIYVSFRIWEFENVTHEYITQLVDIQPTSIVVKGDKKNPKNQDSPLKKYNGWFLDSNLAPYGTFDEQMNSLLNVIEPKIAEFKDLCEKYSCEFSCALYLYFDNGESTPSVHLDSRYNKLIKDLNIDFDVDLYVLPNENEIHLTA